MMNLAKFLSQTGMLYETTSAKITTQKTTEPTVLACAQVSTLNYYHQKSSHSRCSSFCRDIHSNDRHGRYWLTVHSACPSQSTELYSTQLLLLLLLLSLCEITAEADQTSVIIQHCVCGYVQAKQKHVSRSNIIDRGLIYT